MRAAGLPPISTVDEPLAIVSGGPTHVHMLPTVAAGRPPIRTVGTPGGRIGPPTCGTGPVVIGHVCMSVMRAAGGIRTIFPHAGPADQVHGKSRTRRVDRKRMFCAHLPGRCSQ